MNELEAISPLDGRYRKNIEQLAEIFNEKGLIKHRLIVEGEYFIFLSEHPQINLRPLSEKEKGLVRGLYTLPQEEAEIVKELGNCYSNEELIILVNICFKWHTDVKRTEFAGIKRIVKEGLRINWLRREAIIVYGTLTKDEVLNCPIGQIFKSNEHHLYFDLTKIKEVDLNMLIDSIVPIPDEKRLREIIIKYCALELQDFISDTVHHYLEKMYKLDSNFEKEREQFLLRLRHVKRIFPDLETEEMDETIELLGQGNKGKKEKIKDNLKSILKNIEKKEEELSHVSS